MPTRKQNKKPPKILNKLERIKLGDLKPWRKLPKDSEPETFWFSPSVEVQPKTNAKTKEKNGNWR